MMSPMRRRRMRRIFFTEERSIFGLSLWFNGCLVYKHDRDVILYGINPVALDTFEAFFVGRKFDVGFAFGTGQDFKQLGVYCHGHSPPGYITTFSPQSLLTEIFSFDINSTYRQHR